MSGRPGKPAPCSLKRKPRRCSALLTAISGRVFFPRIPAIIRDLVAVSTESAIQVIAVSSQVLYRPRMITSKGLFVNKYSVVDIFAGPGGLAEGFSKVRNTDGSPACQIALSIEKDATAHSTLLLRAFLRQFGTLPPEYYHYLNQSGSEPDWSSLYPDEWRRACDEAWCLELGKEDPGLRLDARLDRIRNEGEDRVILIGGPPCQAYSLVGRARNAGNVGYVASEDDRHFLYEEYIRILDRLSPAAFVMENVKGLLSSTVDGKGRIVDQVLSDLRGDRAKGGRYRLVALAPRIEEQGFRLIDQPEASDFVVRAEEFGIPQARHRVIIVGIREDIAMTIGHEAIGTCIAPAERRTAVRDVLDQMPRLRSGLSRSADGAEQWKVAVLTALDSVASIKTGLTDNVRESFIKATRRYQAHLRALNAIPARTADGAGISESCPPELKEWLVDPELKRLPNNETRGHMPADLARYFFAALHAELVGKSPTSSEFPDELAPSHRSWSSGKFADRFRVQSWNNHSTTITCHISKDGHYFIHPDPLQCRSLTVREAARLQTFPDNYYFKGGRTAQYVQVGNAVPPLLAKKLGDALLSILSGRKELCGAGEQQAGSLVCAS